MLAQAQPQRKTSCCPRWCSVLASALQIHTDCWGKMMVRSVCICVLVCAVMLGGGCGGEQSRQRELDAMAASLDADLVRIREGCVRLSEELAGLLSPEALRTPCPKPPADLFRFYEDVTYYKTRDDGLGGVWASGFVPVDEGVRDRICRVQAIMPSVRDMVESTPGVVQAYFLSSDNYASFYPYLNGVAFFDPLTDFSKAYMPYYSVTPEARPGREPFWIRPYVDATGKGYVVSVTVPVDVGADFAGAVGADVRVVDFLGGYLDPKRRMLLMSGRGLPLAMTDSCAALMGVSGISDPHYFSGGIVDQHVSDELLLRNSPSMTAREVARVVGNTPDVRLQTPQGVYRVLWSAVPETGWHLVEIVEARR